MQKNIAYLVVLSSVLVHMSPVNLDNGIFYTVLRRAVAVFLSCKALSFLLYPLLGWMADVCFTRYKFVLFSFIIMILGSILVVLTGVLVLEFPQKLYRYWFYSIAAISIIMGLIGIGMFDSTAIQFGMDQMLEASSNKLSTFIHWYFWSSNLGSFVILYICYAVLYYYHQCNIKIQQANVTKYFFDGYEIKIGGILGISCGLLQLVCAFVGVCVIVYYKRHLKIDQTGEHPIKLIYQVLKYAWHHKCPENRSAFTYWEEDIPPRIDLGKMKYGGPFTTEEVEDTKTFFRIILLLLSLVGFHLSGHGYSLSDQLTRRQCPAPFWVSMFVVDTMHITLITIIVGVPLYQFVVVRCCKKCAPNMLKRMGIGLMCCLIQAIAEIIIHATMTDKKPCEIVYESPLASCYIISSKVTINGTCSILPQYVGYCEDNSTSFLPMIVPCFFQGIAFLFVFMTTLEFICAQAPLRLKGLLIGVWFASLAVYYLPVGVSELFIVDRTMWEVFHEVKAFLIFLSLMAYLHVSRRYHYRQRDEVVNEQFLVEEIYERRLAQAADFEKGRGNSSSCKNE